jgi:hypothetical protein
MGKRSHETSDARCKPLVEVDLLAHTHPAFHPRPMYYNVSLRKLLSFLGAISLQREIRVGRGHQELFTLFSIVPHLHNSIYVLLCSQKFDISSFQEMNQYPGYF